MTSARELIDSVHAPERGGDDVPLYLDGAHAPHPVEVLQRTVFNVGRLAVVTSFQSSGLVILHMLRDIGPMPPVLFLETGFHFDETLDFVQEISALWDLQVVRLRGAHGSVEGQKERYGPELYRRDPEQCCYINKVRPLQLALEEYDAWVSGLRRDQSAGRADTPIIETQALPSGRTVLKIHPLAYWTEEDVHDYIRRYDIPTHPLLEKGFASIGCWPCTRPVQAGEDKRAGRWDGFSKIECGIHTFGTPNGRGEIG
jgi:phosphoadenosine phosphosulfate reductase